MQKVVCQKIPLYFFPLNTSHPQKTPTQEPFFEDRTWNKYRYFLLCKHSNILTDL